MELTNQNAFSMFIGAVLGFELFLLLVYVVPKERRRAAAISIMLLLALGAGATFLMDVHALPAAFLAVIVFLAFPILFVIDTKILSWAGRKEAQQKPEGD